MIYSFEEQTTQTTSWEHAWGFEFSYEESFETNFFVADNEMTITAKMSYNGKYGTSTTTSDTQRIENIKTFPCPPRSKCDFRLIANHLDNQAIPFTALVRKTIGSDEIEYEEKGRFLHLNYFHFISFNFYVGTWYGVQSFNFLSQYCTTNLDTNETNCPFLEKINPNPKLIRI